MASIMDTSFGERLAVLISCAACFDLCICGFLPGGAHGRAMKALLLTAAVAKVFLAWLSLKMKFKVCLMTFRIRSPEMQAMAHSLWFGFSATVSLALLVCADSSAAPDPRHLLLICFRMLEFSVFVGVVAYASRQEEKVRALFQTRVWHLCTLDDLKNFRWTTNVDLNKLSCCICLEEFRPHDTIAMHYCNHVAHMACEHKLTFRRRSEQFECPMMCTGNRTYLRCFARRMYVV
eukprot:TRINITY_DN48122_c0_g1_i1.p1 TRINITY_DN48122_c0_g1~~TRINITY_DN48122_c0_g1_i1.p1  ORF type:complete len:234 (-),score=23.05 TRINITY_DN48122_c0_g1_i1:304-1005(-)